MAQRLLGVTVLPEFIQNETADGVLDNLQRRAGVFAVSTSPYVMAPDPLGGREPPIDGGAGDVRLLDRPLWGQRALHVRTAPSFRPDCSLYRGLAYQPPQPDMLTERDGARVGVFIRAAKARGLKVYLQVQAACPPGYRVQFGGPSPSDRPRMPDGGLREGGVDNNASLGSPAVIEYGCALLRDLVRAYPEIDGIRLDWPEYPPYDIDSLFFDFSKHAMRVAAELNLDVERMTADVRALHRTLLGGLTDKVIAALVRSDALPGSLLHLFANRPGIADWLALKARLATRMLAAYRTALTEAGGAEKELVPQAFPPPWSDVSGFSFAQAVPHSAQIGVKLYTMHWPMIVRNYVQRLAAANPGVSDTRPLLDLVLRLLDLHDPGRQLSLEVMRYPEPDEPHWTGGPGAQQRKLAAARAASGTTPIIALCHGYGPLEDVRARVEQALEICDNIWVNRYGYLSNEKLDALGELMRPNG
jgi:hypothetical protein